MTGQHGLDLLFAVYIVHEALRRLGGALLGGFILDQWGIAVVPWIGCLIIAAGLVFVLATDPARERLLARR